MPVARYTVKGMSCDHCVRSVTDALTAIPLVTDADVDLTSGLVTVTSTGDLDRDRVEAAVVEAGYEVVS